MTGPPLRINGLLACPRCTYLRSDHPELDRDYIALPVPWQGRAGKRWYLSERCPHGADLFGPFESEAAAKDAWNTRVASIAERKTQAA